MLLNDFLQGSRSRGSQGHVRDSQPSKRMHFYLTLRVPGDAEGVPSDSHCGFLGAATPGEVITWPSSMWIQMCFSCFPRYVTFSKSFIPCSEVPLMTLEGFCGNIKRGNPSTPGKGSSLCERFVCLKASVILSRVEMVTKILQFPSHLALGSASSKHPNRLWMDIYRPYSFCESLSNVAYR